MRKAGDIISLLFKERFGEDFADNARSSAELFNSWEKTVCQVWPHEEKEDGDVPAAAIHSRIKEFERGMLIVETDHPGWIQILQTKQAELLLTIQRYCPKLDIRGIAFRLSRETLSPKRNYL
jgi:predicted nucleic acid-binding Zn ribbon protein